MDTKRIWKGLGWVAERADALVAFIAGATFAVLGFAEVRWAEDHVGELTLALLSILGLALLRERSNRQELTKAAEDLSGPVAQIREGVGALQTGAQYRVLRQEVAWDLQALDGSYAEATKLKKLRFVQNRVVSLFDYGSATGTVDEPTYQPAGVTAVDAFEFESKTVALISLRRIYNVGDELSFGVKRILRNSFLADDSECVSINLLDPTDLVVLKVTWPRHRPPTEAWLEHKKAGVGMRRRVIEEDELRTENGRTCVCLWVSDPAVGDDLTLRWDWEPASTARIAAQAQPIQASSTNAKSTQPTTKP